MLCSDKKGNILAQGENNMMIKPIKLENKVSQHRLAGLAYWIDSKRNLLQMEIEIPITIYNVAQFKVAFFTIYPTLFGSVSSTMLKFVCLMLYLAFAFLQ